MPVINETNSNAIISKSKNIFAIFFCISGIYKNLEYFETKDEPLKLFVSDIINCEKQGQLSAEKAAYQNTYEESTC